MFGDAVYDDEVERGLVEEEAKSASTIEDDNLEIILISIILAYRYL